MMLRCIHIVWPPRLSLVAMGVVLLSGSSYAQDASNPCTVEDRITTNVTSGLFELTEISWNVTLVGTTATVRAGQTITASTTVDILNKAEYQEIILYEAGSDCPDSTNTFKENPSVSVTYSVSGAVTDSGTGKSVSFQAPGTAGSHNVTVFFSGTSDNAPVATADAEITLFVSSDPVMTLVAQEPDSGDPIELGDYLSKNQGQQIQFTADFGGASLSSLSLDESDIVWTVSPSDAGTFIGGNNGQVVTWEQADGYVSDEVDDVVIAVTAPDQPTEEFPLTVVNVDSYSFVLCVGDTLTTNVPKSALKPERGLNIGRVSRLLNRSPEVVGTKYKNTELRTRTYDLNSSQACCYDPPEATQLNTNKGDLIVYRALYDKDPDYNDQVVLELEAGGQPGEVSVSWERAGILSTNVIEGITNVFRPVLHRQHVTVVEIADIVDENGNSGPIAACVDKNLTLQAVFNPQERDDVDNTGWRDFKSSHPQWSVLSAPGTDYSLSATQGETTTFTPGEPGTYEIQAQCGSSTRSVIVEVVEITVDDFSVICAGGSAQIHIAVSPSIPSAGVELKISRDPSSAKGSALFITGTTAPVTQTNQIEAIFGEITSDTSSNMIVTVSVGDRKCMAHRFTVIDDIDLDVDGNYDGTVSVDDPDETLEMSAGGLVCVGERDEVVLRRVQEPSSWNGDILLTRNSTRISVFDVPVGGTEIAFDGVDNVFANSALPKTLYVHGATTSAAPRDVTLTFAPVPGGCDDEVAYTVIHVDLDVDANHDGTISVDNPDDTIERSVGGLVSVGGRDEIVLRQVAPPTWNGYVLLTKSSSRIRVFDAPAGGTEITFNETDNKFANIALPKTLYVQGETLSDAPGDVMLTMKSVPAGCEDKVAYTVTSVDFLNASGNVLTELKIATWSSSFLSGPSVATTVKNEFISPDNDRFYVRVYDQSKNGQGSVKIRLSTDSPGIMYDDDATEVELTEDPANSGNFISEDMILVSDDVDDDFTNVTVVNDDTLNDRTHIVALGGKVVVQYPESGAITKEASVPPVLKTINIEVIVLRDKAEALGGTPVVDTGMVSNHWNVLCERYAQTDVLVEWNVSVEDPPVGVDLSDDIAAVTSTNEHKLSAEMKALIDGLGTGADSTDFHAFYVGQLYWDDTLVKSLYGVAIAADFFADASESGYLYNVILNQNTITAGKIFTPAHEVGHCLTADSNHYVDDWNLMHLDTGTSNVVTGAKRFLPSQRNKVFDDPHCN